MPRLALPQAHVWNAGRAPFGVAKFPPSEALTTATLLTLTCISAELKGNKQAEDIKAGVGSLGGLKKSL